MTNHYEKALEYLDEVEVKRADLLDEYSDGGRREVVAQLHQDVGAAMKLAAIHAKLAEVQTLKRLVDTVELAALAK